MQTLLNTGGSFNEETIKKFQAMITAISPNLPRQFKGEYSFSSKTILGRKWQSKPFASPETYPERMRRLSKCFSEYIKFVPEDPTQIYKVIEHSAEVMVDLVDIHPFSDGNGRTSRLLADAILTAGGLYPMPHWLEQDDERTVPSKKRRFGLMMEYACRGDYRLLLQFMTEQQRLAIESEFDAIEASSQASVEAASSGYRHERIMTYDTLTQYQFALTESLTKSPPERLPSKLETNAETVPLP